MHTGGYSEELCQLAVINIRLNMELNELSEAEIIDHGISYAEHLSQAFYDILNYEASNEERPKIIKQPTPISGVSVYTSFTGTVQGIYLFTMSTQTANILRGEVIDHPLSIEELADGMFQEILNTAVGTLIESLKERFGFLTFNPSTVSIGDILFPAYHSCVATLHGSAGSINCTFALNMTSLEITDKLLEIMQKLKDSIQESNIDSLTKIYNRKFYDHYANNLWKRYQPLIFVLFDIDKFKDVNDNYGHASGDIALSFMANILKRNARDNTDYPIRYGGDEFIIILENSPLQGVRTFIQRIKKDLKKIPIILEDGRSFFITISIGVAEHTNSEESFQELFERADQLLYKAKKNGRNCVCGLDVDR